MEQLNLVNLLNREQEEKKLIDVLNKFEENKTNLILSRGVYLYGSPGSGKTTFAKKVLKKLNYDIITYDAGDIRNKTVIDNITKHKISDVNILAMFTKKKKKIAIIMDEIDGMNSGDKGGINQLIKLIRPKKTKKQKCEDITMVPIICIGNYHIDKKIKELIKVCETIELKKPTQDQVSSIVSFILPNIDNKLRENIVEFSQGDLRKINSTYEIYKNHENLLKNEIIKKIFEIKNYNEDTKVIVKNLLNNVYNINDHTFIMNDTDRTSIGLLFHENIIDTFPNKNREECINLYIEVLDNICFSDYIDRITFQKQIWVFNEMSSLIKTMYNNYIFHNFIKEKKIKNNFDPSEVRFTKVLTKYSTEYNNSVFIQNLCRQLNMDRSDLFLFFIDLRNKKTIEEIITLFNNENYEINKLDINRIYRFLNYGKEV
jgi:DNA polymerase III delta prime subunit